MSVDATYRKEDEKICRDSCCCWRLLKENYAAVVGHGKEDLCQTLKASLVIRRWHSDSNRATVEAADRPVSRHFDKSWFHPA